MTQPDTFSRARGNYDLVVALFVALLLISNVAATKLIAFGPEWSPFGLPVLPVITDGGALLFPLTYVPTLIRRLRDSLGERMILLDNLLLLGCGDNVRAHSILLDGRIY